MHQKWVKISKNSPKLDKKIKIQQKKRLNFSRFLLPYQDFCSNF